MEMDPRMGVFGGSLGVGGSWGSLGGVLRPQEKQDDEENDVVNGCAWLLTLKIDFGSIWGPS